MSIAKCWPQRYALNHNVEAYHKVETYCSIASIQGGYFIQINVPTLKLMYVHDKCPHNYLAFPSQRDSDEVK